MSNNRLSGLDGLRALSIGLVLLVHGQFSPGFPSWSWLHKLAGGGGFGVTIFFSISGFLITWLMLMEESKYGTISLPGFYLRRAFRILPPALAYLALLWVGRTAGLLLVDGRELAASALFYRNHLPLWPPEGVLTVHYWSLSLEEQFYLTWPFMVCWIPRNRRFAITLALVLLAPLWRQLNVKFLGASQVNWLRTDIYCDKLLWGALLAILRHDPVGQRWLDHVLRHRWLVLAGILAGAWFQWSPLPGLPMAVKLACPTVSFVLVALLVGLLVDQRFPWLNRLLDLPPVTWVGRLSYSLYVWHMLFHAFVLDWPSPFPGLKDNHVWFLRLPWSFALSLVAASASHYLIELPCLRWRDRLLSRGLFKHASPPRPGAS